MPAAIVRSAATIGLERLMLMSLALVLSLAACQEPEQATGPSLSQSALPNSITLTYICGNAFRVRNTNPTVMTVTWDVYKTTEKGTLTLPAKPGTGPYSETYFTTVNKGTVRLFLDGVLIQTKANGNKPVCQLPADTTRPAMPGLSNFSSLTDTTIVASPPGDTVTIAYRNVFAVRFDDSTSGTTIRAFLVAMQGQIISGNPGAEEYIIQFPDPGPTYQSVDSLQQAIMARVGVDYAVPSLRRTGSALYGRYPNDGTGARRTDWTGAPTDFTRPRIQIRAPLAWGCENGAYGGPRVAVGVVDFYFNRTAPDLAGLLAARSEPSPSGQPMKPSTVNRDHGSEVAGIMVGAGDDGAGVAGMLWNADLSLFSLATDGEEPVDLVQYLVGTVLPQATARGVRVLVMSVSVGPSDSVQIRRIERAIAKYVAAGGLVVKAVGNFKGYRSVETLLQTTGHDNLGLEMAVAKLMQGNPQVRSGLLFVAGTDTDGEFWEESSFYPGMTEILAPATNVATLDRNGVMHTVSSGNSLAAPFVGGVAGLLLAMDPTLTNAELKDYIVRGASMPREDPETGDLLPAPNPGAPDANVRQLDAYGSLKLLSYERPGTPICGLAVLTALVDDSVTQQAQTTVRIEGRPGLVYQGEPAVVTVAQGGRRIGLDRGLESLDLDLHNGLWEAGTIGEYRGIRQFLERDTAFVDGSFGRGESVRIRGPSGQGSLEYPCEVATAGTFDVNFCTIGAVSTTGDWVHAVVERDNSDAGCGPSSSHFASFLVPVRGAAGGATVLRDVRFEACRYFEPGSWSFPVADVVAWRADGAVAWVAQADASISTSVQAPDSAGGHTTYHSTITSMTTKFRQESVVSGVPAATSRTVSGPAVYALGWRVEGGSLLSYEYYLESFGVCVRTVRAGEAPEVEVAGPIELPPSYCGDRQLESMPASVIARSLTSALRPAGGSAATPRALSPVEARIRAIRRRAGPQVLLAN